MDQRQALELAQSYKTLVSGVLPVKDVYLYGSYAKGNQTDESDIDIAVVVDKLSDNYFDDTPVLWSLRRKISLLIEPVLLTEDTDNPLYYDILKTGLRV